MRCMNRNKVRFFYALYEGREMIIDEWGNTTGEYEVKYSNPTEFRANISPAMGETQTRQFGDNVSYDKVIVMDNEAPPIDEYSVLWIDTLPQLNEDGSVVFDEQGEPITPHDYIVQRVAKGLNSISIAVSKVTVRN